MGMPVARACSLEAQADAFLAAHGMTLPVLDVRRPSRGRGVSVTAECRGTLVDLERLVSGDDDE